MRLHISVRRAVRRLATALKAAMTLGGDQQFLGASWVNVLLSATPRRRRYAVTRRLLALSPHYIYVRDELGTKAWPRAQEIEADLDRNRVSRAKLVTDLIVPRSSASAVLLDYGCGPGYAAAETARSVRQVYAADISAGVLRCAEVLHNRPNLRYVLVENGRLAGIADATVDVTYSFAVFQHMTDRAARQALDEIARVMRPGGTLLLHVIVDHSELPTERDWLADRSLTGRVRAQVSLHVFSRSHEQMVALVSQAGFRDIEIVPAATLTSVDDEVAHDQILSANRGPDAPASLAHPADAGSVTS